MQPGDPSHTTHDRDPRCRGCGYALRLLPSGDCPECGRPFDWNKRSTFRTADEPRWLATQLQTRGVRLLAFALIAGAGEGIIAGLWAGVIPWAEWSCCLTVFLYPVWLTASVVALLAVVSPSGWLGLLGCVTLGCITAVLLALPAGYLGLVIALPAGLVGGLVFKHMELSNIL